mgnify:FL=1
MSTLPKSALQPSAKVGAAKPSAPSFGVAAAREVTDDPRVLYFRLSPEVTAFVKRFLESRGWIDLSLRHPHPSEDQNHLVGAGSSADQRKRPARSLEYYRAVPPLWSLWWEDYGFLPALYSNGFLAHSQMLNHLVTLPTVYRKDVLALRMAEARVLLRRHNNPALLKGFRGFPQSFILPRGLRQMTAAVDAAAAAAATNTSAASTTTTTTTVATAGKTGFAKPVWICKPTAAARGFGIFLFDSKEVFETKWAAAGKPTCVVQVRGSFRFQTCFVC